jgi:DGQHR domain-containing protein
VRFEPSKGPSSDHSRAGVLVIPMPAQGETLPGFIVDGQQRIAAIRDAAVDSFPICVTAFVTDDLREQTEQFILVNSTKPLPKGLIYELLPNTEAALPTLLARRKLPAYLVARLNHDKSSPLHALIQTPTNPGGTMKDNSMLRMIENSINDGLLYRLRTGYGEAEPEPLLGALFSFWGAVKEVFADSWGLPPKRSRLMHGAGVVSLGFVMDAIAERYRSQDFPTLKQFKQDLRPLKGVCRWTDGYWDFGPGQQRKWSDVQNTSKDVQLLSNYLLLQYKALVWGKSRPSRRQLSLAE